METKEKIKVYIDIQDGKTVCICKRSHKGCGKKVCWMEEHVPPESVWAVAIGHTAQERYMTYESKCAEQ